VAFKKKRTQNPDDEENNKIEKQNEEKGLLTLR
jgi:hypothetical protein